MMKMMSKRILSQLQKSKINSLSQYHLHGIKNVAAVPPSSSSSLLLFSTLVPADHRRFYNKNQSATRTTTSNSISTTTCIQNYTLMNAIPMNSNRRFSTNEAATKEQAQACSSSSSSSIDTETTSSQDWMPEQFTRDRPESILNTSFPDGNYTAGQAWFVVQNKIGGGHQIRHSDFVSICNATQSAYPKDAKLLSRILIDIKKKNRFILTQENAQICIDGMYRSLLPKGCDSIFDDGVKGYFKVQCGLKIGEAFLDKDTGLYVALDTDCVNEKVLEPLFYGLKDLQQNIADHLNDDDNVDTAVTTAAEATTSTDDNEEGGQTENDGNEESRNDKYLKTANDLLSKSITLSKDIFDTLLTRASNPTRYMKKRAKRKYLSYLRSSSGPSPATIDLVVKICLLEVHQRKLNGGMKNGENDDGEEVGVEEGKIDGLSMAKSIVNVFEEKQYLGAALPDTHALIQETEEMLLVKVSEEAATEDDSYDNEEKDGESAGEKDDDNATEEKK